MRYKKQYAALIVLSVVFLITLQPRAYAYLDSGSAGFFIQMLLAALIGVSFAIKNFWRKVKEFFAKIFLGRKGPKKKP